MSGVKDPNPKDAIAVTKAPLHLIPMAAQVQEAIGYSAGAYKYGRHNFRGTPVLTSVYLGAALRHLFAWIEGEEYDDEGLHNLGALRCCTGILLDAQYAGTLIDDRPMKVGDPRDLLNMIQERNKEMLQGYVDRGIPKAPDYTRSAIAERATQQVIQEQIDDGQRPE